MHSDTRALSALSSLYGLQRYSCDFFNTAAVALTEGEAKRENHKASITRRDIKRGNDNSIKHKKRIQLDTVHERRTPLQTTYQFPRVVTVF